MDEPQQTAMEILLTKIQLQYDNGASSIDIEHLMGEIKFTFLPLEKEQHRCIWRSGKFNRKPDLNEEKIFT